MIETSKLCAHVFPPFPNCSIFLGQLLLMCFQNKNKQINSLNSNFIPMMWLLFCFRIPDSEKRFFRRFLQKKNSVKLFFKVFVLKLLTVSSSSSDSVSASLLGSGCSWWCSSGIVGRVAVSLIFRCFLRSWDPIKNFYKKNCFLILKIPKLGTSQIRYKRYMFVW